MLPQVFEGGRGGGDVIDRETLYGIMSSQIFRGRWACFWERETLYGIMILCSIEKVAGVHYKCSFFLKYWTNTLYLFL